MMAQVLVIDDDPEVIDLLLWILRQEGYEAAGFTAADEARRAIKANPPALVLLDLNMPQVSGVELCRELKSDPRLRQVRVVILSGHGFLEREAASAGADGYLGKPFDLDDVIRCVAQQLGSTERTAGGENGAVHLV